ncbi:hypothetical protein J0A67_16215 [Algoriphagus aestuariicola]|uniref:Uncharacterized protein n=1 Tax=Algoriphagus aestuariicola TaxID=1852016 RepID=A0ABS3BT08_9BACT|nr:hypothetical protein [Algoriphagus aestuariicola]MBN7802419.1 hypothetical protein [Algoriphagus aestuariicola]
MKVTKYTILKILKVGHDTSMRGEGISMHEALYRLNYKTIRHDISAENLHSTIELNPEIINEWVLYSEDKRTDGGYGLQGEKLETLNLNEQVKLTADYVLRELDFWSQYQ